jgi:NADH-quinone oxidoreductase subunit A
VVYPTATFITEEAQMGYEFGAVAAFALVAVGFGLGGLTLGKVFRPYWPSADKALIYECGERPIGNAWINFNPRFYLVALVFVIFEVDIALTFPVVAVYRDWVAKGPTMAWVAFGELFMFTVILLVGLAWVWVQGDLDWVKKLAALDQPISRSGGRSQGPRQAA